MGPTTASMYSMITDNDTASDGRSPIDGGPKMRTLTGVKSTWDV